VALPVTKLRGDVRFVATATPPNAGKVIEKGSDYFAWLPARIRQPSKVI